MLIVTQVKEYRRVELPEGYHNLPLWDRLYTKRIDIQSIPYLDFSARIQTVHKQTNACGTKQKQEMGLFK